MDRHALDARRAFLERVIHWQECSPPASTGSDATRQGANLKMLQERQRNSSAELALALADDRNVLLRL